MARFLHSGDWQLGMTRRFLSGDAQARYSQARLDAIRQMATLADDGLSCGGPACAAISRVGPGSGAQGAFWTYSSG